MSIKVTDRRMFTEDGQLRAEYAEEAGGTEPAAAAEEAPPPSEGTEPEAPEPQASAPPPSEPSPPPPSSQPSPDGPTEPRHPAAQLLEIVQMLVEPAMLFMGEAPMPDGQTVTDLERARIYIDLLSVLEEKTQGNLTPEEAQVLGDVLYQLRMRFVQKKD